MSRTISVELSVKGIESLKRELLAYKDSLSTKCEKLARNLAEQGVEIAKANIVTLDAIFTSELLNSIHMTESGGVFCIVADSEHAAWVEFGTGQLGKEASYPHPFPEGVEWNYNTGKTIFEIAPGQYGWFYPRDGQWYFTQGMPSRPFLYDTAMELRKLIVAEAIKVFRE